MEKNKILWVTGFSESYYNAIGKNTIAHWNKLSEDKLFLSEMDISNLPGNVINIKDELSNFHPLLQKEIFNKSKKAYKFFKKAFCIWFALKNYKSKYDYIIWLDTDAVIENSFNVDNFLPEDDQLFSTIIRGEHGCDSGFVAFNTNYKNFDNLVTEYIDYYIDGKIWSMFNPWDAYILEDFLKEKNLKIYIMVDLHQLYADFKIRH